MQFEYQSSVGDATLVLYPIGSSADGGSVREGGTYKYRIDGPGGIDALEPAELFEADPDDVRTGRFLPMNHVGDVTVHAMRDRTVSAEFLVSVLPFKLDHEHEYRAMLEQIADHAAEATLRGFAPSHRMVGVDPSSDGELPYRSLAFLVARLRSSALRSAFEQIRRVPHRAWTGRAEPQPIGRGLRSSSRSVRVLGRHGARAIAPAHLSWLPTGSVPRQVVQHRTEETFDTQANRFIRYALERWSGLAQDVRSGLGQYGSGAGPVRRGRREAEWLVDECDRLLTGPPLSEAGVLTGFPVGDPVLMRKPGYRDVLRTFALAEASIDLDAVVPDDLFSATQRNIAALYEYWCYIALLNAVTAACGADPHGALFRVTEDGLSLALVQGRDSKVSWRIEVGGRQLDIVLWFNRTFRRSSPENRSLEASTWSNTLRPDISIRIRPRSARPSAASDPALDVWLHFDAKYRLDKQSVLPGDDPVRNAKSSDVLRMHAYRDAIRRSAGAYVLYPGDGGPDRRPEFDEVIPGIGAFPLRPIEGDAHGTLALEEFIRDVLEQAANQASASERAQYWLSRHTDGPGQVVLPANVLTHPPADEPVIVGYVRAEQLDWVRRTHSYNLRADGRRGAVSVDDDLLRARLVLLWTGASNSPEFVGLFERVDAWVVASSGDLAATGYPARVPEARYLVTAITAADARSERLVDGLRRWTEEVTPDGRPSATTWERLVRVEGRANPDGGY